MTHQDKLTGWLVARALAGLPVSAELAAQARPGTVEALVAVAPRLALQALPEWRELAALAAVTDPEGPLPEPDPPRERLPGDPHWYAARVLARHSHPDGSTLRRWQEQWWQWSEERGWQSRPTEELAASLNRTLREIADEAEANGESARPLAVGPTLVTAVSQAVMGRVLVPTETTVGDWLDGREDGEHVPFANGLAPLPSLLAGRIELIPHTPAYWTPHRLAYPLETDALCPYWLRFLESLWPEDRDSLGTLQEWFGWCLVQDTRHHKMLCLLGPRRAGKSTIAHVLQAIVGESRTVNPSLGSLGTDFGLEALIGRSLAVFSDARLPSGDTSAIVERLLSLAAFDRQTVNRKYRSFWHGQIPIRLVLVANDLPAITDTSLALVGRMIVLSLRRSWYDQEDLGLLERLRGELPGILRWSVEGLRRLHARGRFLQPTSGQVLVDELAELASPVEVFASDALVWEEGSEVACEQVFAAWCRWNESRGARKHGTLQWLGRQLRSVLPSLERSQSRDALGKRIGTFKHLRIRPGYAESY